MFATGTHPVRRLVVVALTALMTMAGCEGGARLLATRLDPPNPWFSPSAYERISYLESPGWSLAGIETIFVGSSVVASGVDAALYDRLTGRHSANMALPSADVMITDRWVIDEILVRTDVDHVVYGLTTLALNANDVTPVFPRYDHQVATDRGWRGALQRAAFARLTLVSHAGAWRDPASMISDLVTRRDDPALTTPFFDLPLPPRFDLDLVDDPNELRTVNLANFEVGQQEIDALNGLLATLEERSIDTTIVFVPVHSGYIERHPGGMDDFNEARDVVASIAEEHGARFVDLNDALDDSFFIDHLHVDRQGSEALTALLACAVATSCP